MKEFALKHPFLTFLLVDGAITGIVKIVTAFTGKGAAVTEPAAETAEEKEADEE